MKRKLAVLVAGVAAVTAVTATALAVTPGETPFPSPTIVSLFVTTNTFTSAAPNLMTSRFPVGSTVNFKVFAADAKTKKVLTGDDVRYAFIRIPGQPNVKLTYVAPTERNGTNFTGTWTIPANQPTGIVQFVTRFQSKNRKFGNFVQLPVETSQLTVIK
jgi:hypothetical protein